MSRLFKYIIAGLSVLLITTLLIYTNYTPSIADKDPIKIGIIAAITNTYMSDQPNVNVALMAIEEINAHGGLLGRNIEPIVIDGTDDEAVFAQKTKELIDQHDIAVLFSTCSSSCRRGIKNIVEESNTLLFHASPSDGLEESPCIIYTNSIPNQSIIPLVTWAFTNLGETFFIVGSKALLSTVSNEMIKQQVRVLGATIIGHEVIEDNEESIKSAIDKIVALQPKVIVNTIYGKGNASFYKQLRAAGITSEQIPTLSLNSDETELKRIPELIGNYTVSGYLEAVDRPENKKFIENYKKKYGQDSTITNTMASSHISVHLWKQAVQEAQSLDPKIVLPIVLKQVFNGPGTIVYLDKNHYVWRPVLIGKALFNQQFSIVWRSTDAVHPEPYPPYHDKATWEKFLNDLFKEEGNA